jgi:hypothetical protein
MKSVMKSGSRGFTFLEFLIGVSIVLVLGMTAFQLFIQTDRTFRDQNLVVEMQENVRSVATLIADDLRTAGQNTPVYNARFETAPAEACQTILDGSNTTRVAFRAGASNVNSVVTTPLTFTTGVSSTVTVTSAAEFNAAVAGATGRFAYLYGKTQNLYSWVRAEITAINVGANTITLTPAQVGSHGATFVRPVTISLEEGVSYRLNGNSVLRGTASNFTSLTTPTMTEATVGNNFTAIEFTYYDQAGNVVTPNTLANRALVWRVDIRLTGQTSRTLSNGTRPTWSMSVRTYPRNLGVS